MDYTRHAAWYEQIFKFCSRLVFQVTSPPLSQLSAPFSAIGALVEENDQLHGLTYVIGHILLIEQDYRSQRNDPNILTPLTFCCDHEAAIKVVLGFLAIFTVPVWIQSILGPKPFFLVLGKGSPFKSNKFCFYILVIFSLYWSILCTHPSNWPSQSPMSFRARHQQSLATPETFQIATHCLFNATITDGWAETFGLINATFCGLDRAASRPSLSINRHLLGNPRQNL